MTWTRGGGSLPGNRRTLVGKEFGFHSTVFETEIGRSEDVSKEICKGLSDCRSTYRTFGQRKKVQRKKGKILDTTFCNAKEYEAFSECLVDTGQSLMECVKPNKQRQIILCWIPCCHSWILINIRCRYILGFCYRSVIYAQCRRKEETKLWECTQMSYKSNICILGCATEG